MAHHPLFLVSFQLVVVVVVLLTSLLSVFKDQKTVVPVVAVALGHHWFLV
jgi:hypothetical protein